MKKWIVVAILLATFGCDDAANRRPGVIVAGSSMLTGPSALLSTAFLVQPSFLDPLLISGAVCPTHPPLIAPLSLGFQGDGRSSLFLSSVQMQFVDRTGVPGGSMIFDRPDLVQRFGSITLPASGTRFFPFEFPFGCVGQPAGTLTVTVSAGDSFGRESRTTLRVPVRERRLPAEGAGRGRADWVASPTGD
jgi:hypothetical protein